jgi:hypothetical protein
MLTTQHPQPAKVDTNFADKRPQSFFNVLNLAHFGQEASTWLNYICVWFQPGVKLKLKELSGSISLRPTREQWDSILNQVWNIVLPNFEMPHALENDKILCVSCRYPSGWKALFLALYTPFGLVLAGLRLIVGVQVLMIAALLPQLPAVQR